MTEHITMTRIVNGKTRYLSIMCATREEAQVRYNDYAKLGYSGKILTI